MKAKHFTGEDIPTEGELKRGLRGRGKEKKEERWEPGLSMEGEKNLKRSNGGE